LNSDGYVISAGSQGTVLEAAELMRENGEGLPDINGSPKTDVRIMDQNSDFQAGIINNLSVKGFHLYLLFHWRQGGQIYNAMRQFSFRDKRDQIFDQAGKSQEQKKAYDYYYNFYQANYTNPYFIEDATYLKLMELAISYTFDRRSLSNFLGGTIKSIRLAIIGKNLYTWTKYSGYDPEVGYRDDILNVTWNGYDYPNYRTFSGTIEIKF
jgi:hypothetical protein